MRRFMAGESMEDLAEDYSGLWGERYQTRPYSERREIVESAIRREMAKGERSKRR